MWTGVYGLGQVCGWMREKGAERRRVLILLSVCVNMGAREK